MTTKSGPLSGVRIIEMDAIGPVPLCGMILSDLGAEVVRISRPGGQAAYADLGEAVLHRGRRTVELNLKDPADREQILSLIASADALMEGMRPGVMERLGLGPEQCHARNPRLVYGRMTGWGQTGPNRPLAGHDINYISMTGALHAITGSDKAPAVPLNLVGDYAGGTMFLALGLVSAILSAKTTGKGQIVDAAIVDGVAGLMGMFHALMASGNWQDKPLSNMLDGGTPYYRCYRCADGGYMAVGALEPQFFALLLDGLGIARDRFVQHDQAGWPEMERNFADVFASAPRSHWEGVFANTDACVSPVLSMTEAMAHPVNTQRGVFVEHNTVRQAAPAPRFSATPAAISGSETVAMDALLAEWAAR
jgi:alpha-methylacyl-CoA racemase